MSFLILVIAGVDEVSKTIHPEIHSCLQTKFRFKKYNKPESKVKRLRKSYTL